MLQTLEKFASGSEAWKKAIRLILEVFYVRPKDAQGEIDATVQKLINEIRTRPPEDNVRMEVIRFMVTTEWNNDLPDITTKQMQKRNRFE